MGQHKGYYRIKTVSRLTGIAATTIRAWERRHGVIAPQRTDSGQRLYSDADVARLNRVKAMVDTGLSIGEVAEALAAEDNLQIVTAASPPVAAEDEQSDPFAPIVESLTQAFASLDRQRASQVLHPLLPLYPFEVTFERLLMPTLVELGELWRREEVSVAAPHFGASFIREKLIAMLSALGTSGVGRPRAMMACPQGERHELGLLYLALRLSARGWETIYLGADIPLQGLLEAMAQVNPGIVALSLTRLEGRDEAIALVERLCQASGHTRVLVGGAAARSWRDALEAVGADVIVGDDDLNSLIRAIRRRSPAA